MKAIAAIFVCALAIVLGGALSDPLVERWEDSNAYQRQVEGLQLERQESQLRDWQAQQQATFTSRAAASNLGYLGVGALVVLSLFVGYDMYHQRRTPLIKPDRYGQLPVSRAALVDGEYKQLVYQIALEVARVHQLQAIHQPGQTPANLHQHITQASRLSSANLAELPQLEEHTAAVVLPFSALLDQGRVGKGNPLILGYDVGDRSEITGSWLDLYSTAVSGMPGSGKTTSQRFLACQTALHGAKFAICDPHAGAADDSLATTLAPLSAAFVCEPASSDKAILEVMRYVADVGRRRIEGKVTDTTPLILWVDELTSLLSRSTVADELAELLERVAQEYRKRWVFVCASGQIWTAARTTSELRDSFASVLCHRMKRSQARLLLPTDEAEQVERLSTGQAVLWRTSGVTQTIAIPNTTAIDCLRVGQLIDGAENGLQYGSRQSKISAESARSQPSNSPKIVQSQPSLDQAHSASISANVPSAEDARIIGLFLDGMDASDIVTELTGMKSNAGKPYQIELRRVQAVIRRSLRGVA